MLKIAPKRGSPHKVIDLVDGEKNAKNNVNDTRISYHLDSKFLMQITIKNTVNFERFLMNYFTVNKVPSEKYVVTTLSICRILFSITYNAVIP